MAKRFTDTDKYKKPFIRGLLAPYKLLWDYLYHDCNHAGIWIVDFEIAQIYLGKDAPVDKDNALAHFNKNETRIIELDNGDKWFIPSFINFQYGELKENNRAHKSVLDILKKYNLFQRESKPLASPLQRGMEGCKDKDKALDKDMDKDLDKEKEGICPTAQEVGNFFIQARENICPDIPEAQIKQSALKYFNLRENERWLTRQGRIMLDWKLDATNWLLREKQYSKPKQDYKSTAERKKEKENELFDSILNESDNNQNEIIQTEFEVLEGVKQLTGGENE